MSLAPLPALLAVCFVTYGLRAQDRLAADLPTLTTIGAIHRMTCAEAAKGYPVHVTGVITYYDPYLNHPRQPVLMVTDTTASIYVALPGETTMPLKPGLRVEVWGQSGPGDFAPTIDRGRIRILGEGSLPANAPRETLTHLLTGSHDAQWSEMEGVVESYEVVGGNVTLKLATDQGDMAATTVKQPGADYAGLVDAKVRIRGIAGSLFNRRSQIIGVQLLFPGMETVTVEEALPEQPYALPVSPVSSLMQYAPGRETAHRVHVEGAVTLLWPGRVVCIEDGSGAMCAPTAGTAVLALGQTAEVVGFPQIGNVMPTLSDATYQGAFGTRAVAARRVDATEAFGGEHDAQLVEIEGRMLARDRASQDPTIVVSSGKFNFLAVLPKTADAGALPALEEGSRLRLTGICAVEANAKVFTRHDGYPVPRYFQIMLRSASDVVVLERPSWWTARHAIRVLAGALGATLCVLGWVIYLRIRMKEQTALLRHQATHDGLTGIWNRKAVLDLLQREFEIAARAHSRIGVMMLDVDHFKRVNDTYGHLAGDAVLKELSRRIQLALRSYDLAGRYGGEEFLVVLPGCNAEEVLMSAERVRVAIAEAPIHAEGRDLAVTVSVGTAALDPLVNTQRDALVAADRALYRAKNEGRNRVVSAEMVMAEQVLG